MLAQCAWLNARALETRASSWFSLNRVKSRFGMRKPHHRPNPRMSSPGDDGFGIALRYYVYSLPRLARCIRQPQEAESENCRSAHHIKMVSYFFLCFGEEIQHRQRQEKAVARWNTSGRPIEASAAKKDGHPGQTLPPNQARRNNTIHTALGPSSPHAKRAN